MKCPKCKTEVVEKYSITSKGKTNWLAEEIPLTIIDKKIQKRMGLPFASFKIHMISKIMTTFTNHLIYLVYIIRHHI